MKLSGTTAFNLTSVMGLRASGVEASWSAPLLTQIVLPDQTSYRFTYDSQFAELQKISFPAGGYAQYTWQTISIDCTETNPRKRVVSSRTVYDGSTSATWNYQWSVQTACDTGNDTSVLISKPDGNDEWHNSYFSPVSRSNSAQDSAKYFSGRISGGGVQTPQGALIRSVVTNHALLQSMLYRPPLVVSAPGDTSGNVQTLGGGPENFVGPATSVITTLDDGSVTETDFTLVPNGGIVTYDNPTFNMAFEYPHGQTLQCACINYPGIQATSAYDYGQGAKGPLLKTTTTHYQFQEASSAATYKAANLIDLPSSIVLTDSAGVTAAQTGYTYDESSYSPGGPQGDLTSVIKWRDSSNTVSTHTSYNSAGMPVVMTDARGITSTVNSYQCSGLFPQQVQIASGTSVQENQTYAYDCNTGNITSYIDANGNTTSYSYADPLSRLTHVTYPDTGIYDASYTDGSNSSVILTTATGGPQGPLIQKVLYDGLGRTTSVATAGGASVDTLYDSMGRVAATSNPHYSSASSTDGWTSFAYDPLGRQHLRCNPDNGTPVGVCTANTSYQEWDYVGASTLRSDEKQNSWLSRSDALGRLVGVTEPTGLTTSYLYSSLSDLTSAVQAGLSGETSRSRTFTYDFLSRLLTASNPETGTVCYGTWAWGWVGGGPCQNGYDANGNLLVKTDARGITTQYQYDALNRMTFKSHNNGDPSELYYYDGQAGGNPLGAPWAANAIGRLSYVTNGYTTASLYGYDAMGRLQNKVDCIGGNYCSGPAQSATYDLAGNITSYTYPDGRQVFQGFDGAGRLNTVYEGSSTHTANYVLSTTYNPDGSPSVINYGNSVTESLAKNSRLQPCKQTVQSGSQTILDHRYFYGSDSTLGNECTTSASGNNGNIMHIVDGLPSGFDSQHYVYDSLNRLTQWNGASPVGAPRAQRYSYDSFGNMAMSNSSTFPSISGMYNTANQVATTLPCVGAPGVQYNYDQAGNMNCQGTQNVDAKVFRWDAESRIAQVSAEQNNNTPLLAANYIYDGEGSRARSEQYFSTGPTTSMLQSWRQYSYFNGQMFAEVDQNNAWTDYIYASGKKIARVVGAGSATNTVPTTTTTSSSSSYGSATPTGGALHLHGSVTSTDPWAGQSFMIDVSGSLQDYTIVAGDKLVMRQKQPGNVQGGIPDIWANCIDPTKGGNQYLHDQDGASLNLSSVHNAWQMRVFDLTQAIGCRYGSLRIGPAFTANTGPWEMWIADIALVHADGTQIPIFTSTHQVGYYAYGQPPTEQGASMEYVADSAALEASVPDGALHMSGNVTSTGLFAGQSWALDISGSLHNYTIQPGDKLVLRQKQRQGVRGVFLSMWADCATNPSQTHNQYLFDQNGESMEQGTVYGVWQERTFDMSVSVGCLPQSVRVGHWKSATTGPWEMWLGDMLIRSSTGRETPIYAGWWQAGAYTFNNIQPETELGGTAEYDPTATVPTSGGSGGSGSGGAGSGSSGSGGSTTNTAGATTTFLITDHLGTASMEFSSTGALLWQGEFAPFGAEVDTQPTTNRFKFTGKERDAESGLDYFGARYYASNAGRFMSPDPLLNSGRPDNPQTWNRYSYALNNPLTIIDPTGLYNLINNCAADNKQCNKDFNQSAKNLKDGLAALTKAVNGLADGDQKTALQGALGAIGTENDGNNVGVQFGKNADGAAGNTQPGVDSSGSLKFTITFDPSKNQGMNNQAINAAHEGQHVEDISDPRFNNPATTLSYFSLEYRGYRTSAFAASALGEPSLSYGKNGQYPIWNGSWGAVDKNLTRFIPTLEKPGHTDHQETTPHDPWSKK